MSLNIQEKWTALRGLGYTGAQEDMELEYYLDNGATTRSVRDAENEFLTALGYTTGTVEDKWKSYLTFLSYTGTVDDMLKQYWASL